MVRCLVNGFKLGLSGEVANRKKEKLFFLAARVVLGWPFRQPW
ncbi:MAG TPA: hypothetical protein VFT06_04335 [Flavisolibacter sp.]|nr:hypothetical protein [Flavisolibacter sp.]